MLLSNRPYLLLILDGFGYRASPDSNAIAQAHTPVWDQLWANYPHILISGSGADVGLPQGQMGNSEVGHLNIGAGRMVPQELGRINIAIENGVFFENPVFLKTFETVKKHKSALHILGLLSDGGVHSHESHIHALLKMAVQQGIEKIYLHAFLDGRDTPPKSALANLTSVQALFQQLGRGRIASLCGRYYAMDRDKRWDRVQAAYDNLTLGNGRIAADPLQALADAYARGETDEFVKPICIQNPGEAPIVIQDQDAVIFMNYRADRARQLTLALTEPAFAGFERNRFPQLSHFVTLTEYAEDFKVEVAYPPQKVINGLGEYISHLGLKQLRVAETEKYAHVTFFFNGGIEEPFAGEERVLVPSPKVQTYDLQPEMSAPEVAQQVVAAIQSNQYDLIVCNFANADMVGHTGNLNATIRAIEALDQALGQIIPALQSVGGEALITADHGNAEEMFNYQTHQPHTAHTVEPVPLLYVGHRAQFIVQNGTLCDVAPSLLVLMGLEQPAEMTGMPLLSLTP